MQLYFKNDFSTLYTVALKTRDTYKIYVNMLNKFESQNFP